MRRKSTNLKESDAAAPSEASAGEQIAAFAGDPDFMASIDLGVGSRLPAHCTSMGRVLLAGLDPDDLGAYLRRVTLVPHTARTIVDRERLRDALAATREAGYALVDQELEVGLRSIAVPVKDFRSRVVAAINIGAQAPRVSIAAMQKTFLPALQDAAGELGLLVG